MSGHRRGKGGAANLIKCGALRFPEPNEPLLLLKNQLYFRNKRNRSLIESLTGSVNLLPYSKTQRILQEMQVLGFGVSDHPLDLFADQAN